MKKGKFSLAQEKELGTIIDQNIAGVKNENEKENAAAPRDNDAASRNDDITISRNNESDRGGSDESPLLPSQLNPREARTMIKQMWLDPETYNRCIQAQAARKQQRIPSSFDALAYDALVYYLDRVRS